MRHGPMELLTMVVKSVINNSPSRGLGNRAPIIVHTDMMAFNPMHLEPATLLARR